MFRKQITKKHKPILKDMSCYSDEDIEIMFFDQAWWSRDEDIQIAEEYNKRKVRQWEERSSYQVGDRVVVNTMALAQSVSKQEDRILLLEKVLNNLLKKVEVEDLLKEMKDD